MNKKVYPTLSVISLVVNSIAMGYVVYYALFPRMATWNLNKTIGWGWDITDYSMSIIFILATCILVFVPTLLAIRKENTNKLNLLSLLINSITIAVLVYQWYLSLSLLDTLQIG